MNNKHENSNTGLGYQETQSALETRIQAHQKYSSFSLEEWVERYLPLSMGEILLDIGCGNGNLFPSYSKKLGNQGVIVGLDQSTNLLSNAAKREGVTPRLLLQWDMNQSFPFVENSFNLVVSFFAIYYADDVERIVTEIKRVLKTEGSLFLIGPTDRNAGELYDFNEKLFGIARDEKINRRTNRLEKEFSHTVQKVFGSIHCDKIPCKLVFPNREEFVRYYLATLLYEESVKKAGTAPTNNDISAIKMPSYEVSKEMIVLYSKKL